MSVRAVWWAVAACAFACGLLAVATGPTLAAGPERVSGERGAAASAPVRPPRLRRLAAADYAAMDASRARELLAAVTVTREGVVGARAAGEAEVRLFLEESRRLGRAGGGGAGAEAAEPEIVIGADERVRVTDTRAAPFRSVGRVGSGCTGTLVGPRHVLTAAHCVFDTGSGTLFNRLDFAPARNGSLLPYGVFESVRALAPAGYVRDRLLRFDYALLVLARPVPSAVGALPLAARPDLAGLSVRIAGYPGDKPLGTMWRSSCETRGAVGDGQLGYDCDTAGGMSGSAVLGGGGGRPAIVAVHGYGFDRQRVNAAAPITAAVRRQLQGWIAAN